MTHPDVRRVQTDLDRRLPFRESEDVDVTFLAANTDQAIPHALHGAPAEIRYAVVRKDRVCDVYDNQGVGQREWTSSYIMLRCDTAGAKVTLRLTI